MSKSNLFAAVADVVKSEVAKQEGYNCKVWVGSKGAISGEAVMGRFTTLAQILEWGADGSKVFASCDLSGLTDAQRAVFRKACGVAADAKSADEMPTAKPAKKNAQSEMIAAMQAQIAQQNEVMAKLLAKLG